MKVSFLRNKNHEELVLIFNNLLKEKFKYNINRASGDFSKTHLFSKNRKNIAKLLTVINEKKRV